MFYGKRLILAKSLGTLAAGRAADNAVPAVWLTPLLCDEECANDISRAEAPALLAAGRGDWREELGLLHTRTAAVSSFAADLSSSVRQAT